MVNIDQEGHVRLANHSETFTRRQDAPEVFDITTVVYVSNPNFIKNHNTIFDGRVSYITVPKERAVDIDDIFDFNFAESLLTKGISNGK